MGHAAASPLREASLARLDGLMAAVASSSQAKSTLLLEHLHSARTYLLGAMPDEYEFSLVNAKEFAAESIDGSLRELVNNGVRDLLDAASVARIELFPIPHRSTSAEMAEASDKSELYRLFHGSATTLGVFYPTHYIFASFPSLQYAQRAAEALVAAGYHEVVATSAEDTFRFMNEIRAEVGFWGALMEAISRFFGTEEVFADIDLDKAKQGAGFLAVYCPREERAEQIHNLVAPFEPLTMQLYLSSGIQSLVAGKSPGPQGRHPENT